jgi:hypothetical protein
VKRIVVAINNRCEGCNNVLVAIDYLCEGYNNAREKSSEIVALHLDRNGRPNLPRRGEQTTGHIVIYKVPLKQLVGEEQKARVLACRAQIQRQPTTCTCSTRNEYELIDSAVEMVVLSIFCIKADRLLLDDPAGRLM